MDLGKGKYLVYYEDPSFEEKYISFNMISAAVSRTLEYKCHKF